VWTLLLSLALAAPPGFEPVGEGAGCQLFRGPVHADGTQPIRAECHWPDVAPRRLEGLLTRFDRLDELIPPVVRSEIVRTEGPRALVHQVAQVRGIAPRQVLVWMERTASDGAVRVSWVTASGERLDLLPRHVRAPRNDGAWEVAPHPDGGSRVVHEVTYDPGGSVPAWVVRWAQAGGLRDVMETVRAAASRPGG